MEDQLLSNFSFTNSEVEPPVNFLNSLAESVILEASRCAKCGRCLSVCPVYRELGKEKGVTRGKLALLESCKLMEIKNASPIIQEILSLCLLCGACAENCPNLVAGDKIIQKAREVFISPRYPSFIWRLLLKHILPSLSRIRKLQKAGRLLQPFFAEKIPSESGIHFRFPFSCWGAKRVIPQLAKESFFEKYSPLSGAVRPDLTLFVGCIANYFFPSMAKAAIGIFTQAKLLVKVPQKQACCGLMAFGAGMAEVYLKLAKMNIEAFAEDEESPIVVLCSSCSAHLKNYSQLFEDGEWKKRAQKFSSRVKDISEFLTEIPSLPQKKSGGKVRKITFHDPCHLRRKQGIFEAPRKLLKNLPEVDFIETGEEHFCCGSGGTFNVSHYDLSQKIFSRRIKKFEGKLIDTVVTTCMGCILQFLDGLSQEGKKIEIKHLVEVLE